MAIIFSAGFEVNTDHHIDWFSTTTTRDTGDAHTGVASLLSATSAAFGSAVQLDNFPYYPVTAGSSYDFEVWYKESTATMPTVSWNLSWRQSDGSTVISTDTISMPRSTTWTKVSGTFVAPALSVHIFWAFQWSASAAGPAVRLDDLLVQDTPAPRLPAPQTQSRAALVRSYHY